MAGFAFSAVAGAMLLHVLPPTEAVPLMMICSIAVQSVSLVVLRKHLAWQGSLTLIIGGALEFRPRSFFCGTQTSQLSAWGLAPSLPFIRPT